MQSTYDAILRQENDEWTGWIEEMPEVNGRATTQEALYAMLHERLSVALADRQVEQQRSADQLTDSLATDYIITHDFL